MPTDHLTMAEETRMLDADLSEALAGFILALRARGYRDMALLNAIEAAPRTLFLPVEYIGFAYDPMTLPLPCGQEAGSPFDIIAAVSALQLEPHHHVLEIGTGSGWQTAVIGGLSQAVASVERWQTLVDAAEAKLGQLDIANVVVAHGDGMGGLPAAGPFDRIIINAVIDALSPILEAQLAEGGIVVAAVESEDGQFLTRFERQGDRLFSTSLGPSRATPLLEGASLTL